MQLRSLRLKKNNSNRQRFTGIVRVMENLSYERRLKELGLFRSGDLIINTLIIHPRMNIREGEELLKLKDNTGTRSNGYKQIKTGNLKMISNNQTSEVLKWLSNKAEWARNLISLWKGQYDRRGVLGTINQYISYVNSSTGNL